MPIFTNPTDSDPRLLQARMALLVRTVPGTLLYNLALIAVVGVVMWPHVPPITLCGWLGYMAVVTALRYLHLRRFVPRDTGATSSLVKLHNWFVVGVFVVRSR